MSKTAMKTKKYTKATSAKVKAIVNDPALGLVTKEPKAAPKPKASKPAKAKDGKVGCLDATAKVLADSKEPMTTKAMIEAMAAKKL